MDETDPFQPKRGFLASSDDAICIFSMKIMGVPVVVLQAGLNLHLDLGNSFTFIIHRRAFLNFVDQYEKPSHGVEQQKTEDSSGAPPLITPTRIPWTEWGPPVSRWFKSDTLPTRWITTTAGQRCVVIAESARQQGSPYLVMDFNPDNYRKMKARIQDATRKEEERLAEKQREREALRKERKEILMKMEEELFATSVMEISTGQQDTPVTSETTDMEEGPSGSGDHELDATMMDIVPSEISDATTNNAEDGLFANPGYIPAAMPLNMVQEDDSDSAWEDVDDAEAPQASSSNATMGGIGFMGFTLDEDFGGEDDEDYTYMDELADEDDDVEGVGEHISNPYMSTPWRRARVWCSEGPETLEASQTFAEVVEGHLPYVGCASKERYEYDGVLLDEERVIGIAVCGLLTLKLLAYLSFHFRLI